MLNTLYCLERDKLPPLQLKAILELRLLTLTDDVDVRTGASLLSDCTELHRLLTAAASAAN